MSEMWHHTNYSTQSFKLLPRDTIHNIFTFYEFPLYRYTEYLIQHEVGYNDEAQLVKNKQLATQWLLKLMFGYFPDYRHLDVFPIFTCISLPSNKTSVLSTMYPILINRLITVKRITHFDFNFWLALPMHFKLCISDWDRPVFETPEIIAVTKNYTFHVCIISEVYNDEILHFIVPSEMPTAEIYELIMDKRPSICHNRKFTLYWRNDRSVFPYSTTLTIEQVLQSRWHNEQLILVLRFNSDLSFTHIQSLSIQGNYNSIEQDYEAWSGCEDFILCCSNLTDLNAVGCITDFTQFNKLKRLKYEPRIEQPLLLISSCYLLREFRSEKKLLREELDQLANLPNLTKLNIHTSESDFKVNDHLTELKLIADAINSSTILQILKSRYLKKLHLVYEPVDNIAFPCYSSNSSITDLSIGTTNNWAELMSFVVQNRSIQHLGILSKSTEVLLNIDQIIPQLLSLSYLENPPFDTIIQKAQNLTSLQLSSSVQCHMDRILLELPKLKQLAVQGCECDNPEYTFQNTRIQLLHIRSNKRWNEKSLMWIRFNTHLQTLIIDEFTIPDSILVFLLCMKSLRVLKCQCYIDVDEVVPFIQQNYNLESLHLFANDEQGVGALHLQEAGRHIPDLVFINNWGRYS
jgi:hypothetical protein